MKKETDRHITRHSLLNQICFNFFTHHTKILKCEAFMNNIENKNSVSKLYCQPTNGTFFCHCTENYLYLAI